MNSMSPYQPQYHGALRPSQFAGGLLPLDSIIANLKAQSPRPIATTTASTLKAPLGYGIAALGVYFAFSHVKSKGNAVLIAAGAVLAGEAVYEIMDGLST